jgi:hypothetical protein
MGVKYAEILSDQRFIVQDAARVAGEHGAPQLSNSIDGQRRRRLNW